MPPKRAKKGPPAPVRRSARIQSREPSLETEIAPDHPAALAIIDIISPPKRSPSPPLTAVVKKTPNKPYTPLRREFTLAKIRQENIERQRKEEEEEEAAAAKAKALSTPPKQLPSPTSPKRLAPPATAPQPRAAPQEQPASGLRGLISSLTGYFTGPFGRKRSAEEADDTPVPANKRTRLQEPNQLSNEDAEFAPPTLAPSNKRKRVEEPSESANNFSKLLSAKIDKPLHQQKSSEEQIEDSSARPEFTAATSSLAIGPDATSRAEETSFTEDAPNDLLQEEESTPGTQLRPAHTPYSNRGQASQSPRAGPSTLRRNEPTSLSTITEHSEFSHLPQIEDASPTPSKPPRVQPPPSYPDLPQNTPSQLRASLHARQPTPRRTPMGTPFMRRAAQLRAAREAEMMGTPSTSSFAFHSAKKAPPSRPKETNADARRAKLERMRELQKELEELQKDEDVQEMQSHRRKRVKIDNLVSIPHNLPGDSSGTFRVPEGDSDDEMEVYDDVEERSNVFEDSERMVQDMEVVPPKVQPLKEVPNPQSQAVRNTPKPQPKPVKEAPTPKFQQAVQAAPTPKFQPSTPVLPKEARIEFHFPQIGPIPEGYYVSEAYQQEACAIFEAGLAEFLAAQ